MKSIIFILSILSWELVAVTSETCGKPEVRRALMHIYRTPVVYVTVYQCYFTSQHTYSDITEECINAFNTGTYIDKWEDKNDVDAMDSPLKLTKYTARADTMQNEILLKSGTTCRYDRGFCYDPRERPNNFAVVWEVSQKNPVLNAPDLVDIFYGWVDIWKLRNNSLKYLVFQDSRKDRSFAVQLKEQGVLGGINFWYTDRYGMLVSQEGLKQNVRPVPHLNQTYFPLKPKQSVSENILRSCDFQNFPFDFDQTTQNYILEPNDLMDILSMFQKQLLETKKQLSASPNGNTKNSLDTKTIKKLEKDIGYTKTLLVIKDRELVEIRRVIKNMLDDVSAKDVSNLKEKIKEILAHHQGTALELSKVKDQLVILQNQLYKLDHYSKKKITLLETTVLKNSKDILETLNTKDKLINDVNNNLRDLYIQIQNKDIELKRKQDDISNRLFNMELDISRQNNDIKKCENCSKLILIQKENNEKLQDKLQIKYNGILHRLNLHDIEIGKCQNQTIFSLSNKNQFLKTIEKEIEKTQDVVSQLERQIKELRNEDIETKTYLSGVDGKTTSLIDAIAKNRQEFITALNKNSDEIKINKENSEQCRSAIDGIKDSKGKDSEELQRNLTDMQNTIIEQDGDIMKLQDILKQIHNKINENDKGFAAAISDCKHYVNNRLHTNDDEITQINDNLITKEREIKGLHENFRKIVEKNKDLEIEIKQKDEEIKRIQNSLVAKDQEFRVEVNKRDEEYKKLENQINEIIESLRIVSPA